MELKYSYTQGEKYIIGYLDDYPEHPTQGVDLPELENNLREIYDLITDGTLDVRQRKGVLEIAG
jgi:hypothetical protein